MVGRRIDGQSSTFLLTSLVEIEERALHSGCLVKLESLDRRPLEGEGVTIRWVSPPKPSSPPDMEDLPSLGLGSYIGVKLSIKSSLLTRPCLSFALPRSVA
ncbi:Hypothetical protein NTJ_08741 [Nesidiocoris tenuis]|uniref:Uncharacterized protein n=1 Tax=Nesidiocoris tenuis TaxID=355587 RepID=A0ABN7AZN4_9HEMI|nr:Hypothetical protein NTJ_08741 [Nesidiocoris tenuis]